MSQRKILSMSNDVEYRYELENGGSVDVNLRDHGPGESVIVDVCAAYPDHENPPMVEYDQMSVRATGGVRVQFDYKRDGYVIYQAPDIADSDLVGSDPELDTPRWLEVAFVPSWIEMTAEEYYTRVRAPVRKAEGPE